MSVRRRGWVGSLPRQKNVTRGVACLLAFGLLFPGGAAIAAPEELPVNVDAVAVESVDTAQVEVAVETEEVVESDLESRVEQGASPEAPAAEPQSDQVVAPLAEQVDTNASVAADLDIVEFKSVQLKKCVTAELGRAQDSDVSIVDLKSLLSLECYSENSGIRDLAPLQYATNLTKLDLVGNGIDDLSPLAALTNLNHLELSANEIDDLSPLAALTNLTTLDLQSNYIGDISPLAGLTNLTSLDLSHNDVSDVLPLKGLINLTKLDLSDTYADNFSVLAGLINLTDLGLGCNKTNDERYCDGIGDITQLAGLTNLVHLNLLCADNCGAASDLSALASLTRLETLGLNGLEINDLTPLAKLTKLTALYLRNNEIVDVSPLAGLNSLTVLVLSGNQIVDVSPLAGLTSLQKLDLSKQQVILPHAISGVPFSLLKPRSIDNSQIQITIASGDGKLGEDSVTWKFPEGGEGRFAWSSEIRLKGSSSSAIFSGTMSQKVLPDGSEISNEVVDFKDGGLESCVARELGRRNRDVAITKSDLEALTQLDCYDEWSIVDVTPLKYATNLRSLSFYEHDIVDASPLAGLTKLSRLELSCIKEDTWCDGIVDVSPLAGLTNLVTLELWGNRIVDVSPLAGLTKLTKLDLSENSIVDVSLLAGLGNLEELYLSHQRMSLDDAISGVKFSLPKVRGIDGAQVPVTISSGKGKVDGDTVTWNMPTSGEGSLGWSTTINLPKTTAGFSGWLTQKVLPQPGPINSAMPTISGTARVGEKLTASPGAWTSGASFTYQWNADGKVIKNATNSTYTLTSAEQGKVITVTVTGSKSGFTSVSKTSVATAKVLAGTLTTATPTISGTAKVGSTLTAKAGTWTTGTTLTYQWLANGKAIKDATKSTYVVKAGELGKTITVKVTGSKTGYTTASKTSKATAKVLAGTLTTATPTISGTVKVGSTLTAVTGKWTSGTTLTYQWYASGKAIKGATKSTFTLTATQLGELISVKVTGSKDGYTTVSKTSVKTAAVAKGTLTTATPTISGTVKVGSTLTAKPGTWTTGTTLTYQWLADGTAIKGATKSSYLLKTTDKGKAITVKVTGSKTGYTTASKTSKATAKVASK